MSRYFWLTLAILLFATGTVFSGSNAFADDQMIEVEPDYVCKCQFKKVPNIAGDYSGAIDAGKIVENTPGTLMVTLTQQRAHIEGTWSASYTDGSSDSGAVTGTVKQKVVRIQFLSSTIRKCKFTGAAKIGSNNLDGGFFGTHACTFDSATFSIDKQ